MNEPAGDQIAGGFVRLRIDLAYDGSEFVGWARQRGLRTVQGELERALKYSCKLAEAPEVTVAGRTDSGVHARGQVTHVDVPVEAWEWLEGRNMFPLRSALPSDIAIHKVDLAPAGFDARFSALSRRYVYRVCDDAALMDPIRRQEVFYHYEAVDVANMNAAAQRLIGLHDFAAFCRYRPEGTTIRELEVLEWNRSDTGLAELTVVADAFCHSMVRSLVGSMLPVGTGAQQPDWPASFLLPATPASGTGSGTFVPTMVDSGRKLSGSDHLDGEESLNAQSAHNSRRPTPRGPFTVAPAHGLTLESVTYPPDAELESRNWVTRRRRG